VHFGGNVQIVLIQLIGCENAKIKVLCHGQLSSIAQGELINLRPFPARTTPFLWDIHADDKRRVIT
jgi:hypothetical protein